MKKLIVLSITCLLGLGSMEALTMETKPVKPSLTSMQVDKIDKDIVTGKIESEVPVVIAEFNTMGSKIKGALPIGLGLPKGGVKTFSAPKTFTLTVRTPDGKIAQARVTAKNNFVLRVKVKMAFEKKYRIPVPVPVGMKLQIIGKRNASVKALS